MLHYEKHFKSQRPDGRFISTMAAHMEQLRLLQPLLALPANINAEEFPEFQNRVKIRLEKLLCLPEFTSQPAPVKLFSQNYDSYTLEKWEFYPDDLSAVPFLILIPEGASAEHPVPGVICLPGSTCSKELLAGIARPNHPNWSYAKFEERNTMALHMVKNGMAAFAFDNPGIGECAVPTEGAAGETQGETRTQMCYGLLESGLNYVGLAVFHKLCFLKLMEHWKFVDPERLAVSAHSLGTETAIALGLLSETIKAVVFNDFLHDDRRRYVAVTEAPENAMSQNIGMWHIIPGKMRYFGFQDLCAAFAPRHLALTEGGAEEILHTVKRAYEVCGAEDRLRIDFYPKYAKPASRTMHGDIPLYGLTREDFYTKYSYVYVSDHSFRPQPAIRLLKECFGLTD